MGEHVWAIRRRTRRVSGLRPSAWTPLAIPTFRAVWLASLASNIGIWLGNVGTAWLMTELRPTPVMVTLVQTAASIPVFLFALPAGAVGDAMDRRRLLIFLQLCSVVLSLLLGATTAFGLTTPGLILVASFLFGTLLAFGMPAFQAIVPDLVPRHELVPAVSLNSIGINVARVIGPALGGLLILTWDSAAPFLINGAFYVAVIVLLLRWLPVLPQASRSEKSLMPLSVASATRWEARHARNADPFEWLRVLRQPVLFAIASGRARSGWGGGAGVYGLLLGCLGAGGIAAVVWLPHWRARFSAEQIARLGSIASAVLLGATAFCRGLWSVVPVLLAAGLAWVAVVATVNVAAQMSLPAAVRARGLSIFMIVFNGMMALGSAI